MAVKRKTTKKVTKKAVKKIRTAKGNWGLFSKDYKKTKAEQRYKMTKSSVNKMIRDNKRGKSVPVYDPN